MARAASKSPSEFPELKCPHGDTAPWRVLGMHGSMLKSLHERLEAGGPKQRNMAAEIRAHINFCNAEIAEIEAAEAARAPRAA